MDSSRHRAWVQQDLMTNEAPSIWTRVAVLAASAVAAGAAIALTEVLADWSSEPMSRIPFVTSIVLVTSLPQSQPAQPRCVLGGHLVCALAGLVGAGVLGSGEIAAAVAVGLAVVGMQVLRVLHPPAGINAFLIPTLALSWNWVVTPVMTGALLLAAYSWLWTHVHRRLTEPDR
jgi:CBS-domain-containing membrane protein